MIVLGTGFVLSEEDEIPGTPWIGWHTVLQESPNNVAATTNSDDAVLLANPSTNLKWSATTATEQYITVSTFTYAGDMDYMGVARHNFGSAGIAVSVEALITNPTSSTLKLLFHFDDNDGSTTLLDSSGQGHIFAAVGNAQIDTSQSKFGGSSLALDGTGDYVLGDGSSDFAFGTGDFTIDFWVRLTTTASFRQFYDSIGLGAPTGNAISIVKSETTHKFVVQIAGSDIITGTTTIAVDTWYHVAVTRSGTNLRLFVNGTQEGGTVVNSTNLINPSGRPVLGIYGSDLTASALAGWLEDVRVVKGEALWTANFTAPTEAIVGGWLELTPPTVPANDSPLMFRFDPAAYYQMRLRMQAGSLAPQAAVMYIGELLVCERSIDINVEHVPITYGRRSHIVNGMSQAGQFLGRIVIGEHRATKAEFKWFQDVWWRANFDPFLAAAQDIPFFWAWAPEEYPSECGYVWLTNNAEASVDTVTRRVHTELVMEGVA